MTRIMIVEDERALAEPLGFLLKKEGFSVDIVGDGNTALRRFARHEPDLVLLDLMLPGKSGKEVCRAIRETSDCPIIMVTARDAEIDRVVGLEIGADDYVTKPYSSRELIARINAVLRRRRPSMGMPTDQFPVLDQILQGGPVTMEVAAHRVLVRGEEVQLPLKEFHLLEYLLRNAGRVVPRANLIAHVWGADYGGDTKTLDVHMKRLRSKVEEDPSHPVHLVTVRGLGYKFEN